MRLVFHEHLQAIPRRKGLRVQNSAIWRKPGDDEQGYHDGALETVRFKMILMRTRIRMRIRMRILRTCLYGRGEVQIREFLAVCWDYGDQAGVQFESFIRSCLGRGFLLWRLISHLLHLFLSLQSMHSAGWSHGEKKVNLMSLVSAGWVQSKPTLPLENGPRNQNTNTWQKLTHSFL